MRVDYVETWYWYKNLHILHCSHTISSIFTKKDTKTKNVCVMRSVSMCRTQLNARKLGATNIDQEDRDLFLSFNATAGTVTVDI
jgi:hypothetical protein